MIAIHRNKLYLLGGIVELGAMDSYDLVSVQITVTCGDEIRTTLLEVGPDRTTAKETMEY